MKRWKVTRIYTVYVEHDEEADVAEIATEFLDESFSHGLEVVVEPFVGEPDDFTFRFSGWARDTSAILLADENSTGGGTE